MEGYLQVEKKWEEGYTLGLPIRAAGAALSTKLEEFTWAPFTKQKMARKERIRSKPGTP